MHYLSLDIEGAEFQVWPVAGLSYHDDNDLNLKVLKSVPWDKVDIEVILVELHFAGQVFPGTRQEVHLFMDEQGYVYVGTIGKSGFMAPPAMQTMFQVWMTFSYGETSARENTISTKTWRLSLILIPMIVTMKMTNVKVEDSTSMCWINDDYQK